MAVDTPLRLNDYGLDVHVTFGRQVDHYTDVKFSGDAGSSPPLYSGYASSNLSPNAPKTVTEPPLLHCQAFHSVELSVHRHRQR